MKYIKYLFIAVCILYQSNFLEALTFNVSLDKEAVIDIQIAIAPPNSGDFFSLLDPDANKVIARYALLITQDGKVFYREKLFRLISEGIREFSLVLPEDHISFPTIKENPFTITLDNAQLQELGVTGGQVFVIVRQRRYRFDLRTYRIFFVDFNILKSDFVSVNAILTVNAVGTIHPAYYSEVPPSQQSRYVVANGSVT